ncbi:MAG: histidine phosphatase family protein [Acidimicrobiia bacterium]|nr:histidine phosphatase family protein [Acidimicrobiia bacterium]
MELLIIRHGRPERVDPAADSPAQPPDPGVEADPGLTAVGVAQSEAMAQWLRDEDIDAVYTSPLRRAVETAAPLERVLGLEARVEPGVVEFDAGNAYIPMEDLKQDKAQWHRAMAEFEERDYREFRQTVRTAIEGIIAAHRGHRVAVVCHAGVINAWAAEILGIERTIFFGPEYTSINRFRASSDGVHSLIALNESAHLRADRLHRMP